MNTTVSCAFTSIYEILQQADKGSLNVTVLVHYCPSVCALAWGTGNPDLSGIGANISYIFQLILTVIFGPIFIIIYGYKRQQIKDQNSGDCTSLRDTQEYLRNLQATFVDTSGQFSIIVAVAGAVRLHQSPPFFEVAFLQSLAIVQLLGLFSICFASNVAMSKPRDPRRVAVLCIYSSILFCFYIAMVTSLQILQANLNSVQELATACRGYGGIWPGYNTSTGRKWSDWIELVLCLSFSIMFGITVAALILRKRTSFRAGPVSFALSLGTLVCFVRLQRTRNSMRSVTGAEFQDNQWGFGQVMAVLLWAPLLFQALYYGLATLFPELKPQEHSVSEPRCHQCRTCNTCAELGALNNVVGQVETGATAVGDQQGSITQTRKETLLERYTRWSKDHERRMHELLRQNPEWHSGMM